MKSFLTIWFGQLLSITGSGLTRFALGIWVYQITGSATKFALAEICATLPGILVSPLAGVLVDRYDRRWMMILSDVCSGITTFFLVLLLAWGRLELWQIYLVAGMKSICSAFQWPAYSALVTVTVPRHLLVRASGMVQFSEALAQFAAPVLAGGLMAFMQIWGIILIDVGSFTFAVFMLGIAATPRFVPDASVKPATPWRSQLLFGWKYIQNRPPLMALLIFFAITNFLESIAIILTTPLVLSFASVPILGAVLSSAGLGMILGSLIMHLAAPCRARIAGTGICGPTNDCLVNVAAGLCRGRAFGRLCVCSFSTPGYSFIYGLNAVFRDRPRSGNRIDILGSWFLCSAGHPRGVLLLPDNANRGKPKLIRATISRSVDPESVSPAQLKVQCDPWLAQSRGSEARLLTL